MALPHVSFPAFDSKGRGMMAQIDDVSLGKYVLQFTGVSLVCMAFVYAITTMLNSDLPRAMSIITLLASTFPTVDSFVKIQGRVMSKSERAKFAGLATLANLIVTAIVSAGFIAYNEVNPSDLLANSGISISLLLGLLAIAASLAWAVIYVASGFMGTQSLKRLEKTKV